MTGTLRFAKIFSFLFCWPFQHPFWVLGGPWGKMVVQAGCCLQKNCLAQHLVHASHGSISQLKALVRNKIQSLPRRYFCLIVPSILCKRGPGDKRISEFGRPEEKRYINLKWNKTKIQVRQSLFVCRIHTMCVICQWFYHYYICHNWI